MGKTVDIMRGIGLSIGLLMMGCGIGGLIQEKISNKLITKAYYLGKIDGMTDAHQMFVEIITKKIEKKTEEKAE